MAINILTYYDIVTDSLYDADGGAISANNPLTQYFGNNVLLSVQYVTSTGIAGSAPSTWTKWDGLVGTAVASTASVDDNYIHAYRGALINPITTGEALTEIDVTVSMDESELNTNDTLTLYTASGATQSIAWTGYSVITGGYRFTVSETATEDFIAGALSRVPGALMIKAEGALVDDTQKDTGLFTFTLDSYTKKLIDLLDYNNSDNITSVFQHKIISAGETIRTFGWEYQINNLIDFDNVSYVPDTNPNLYATQAWVLSITGASMPLIVSPVVGGVPQEVADGSLEDSGKLATSIPTTDEAAAIQGASSPSASNVFATANAVKSNQITGSGTVNMRTDGQFPTNYSDGLQYTIGTGVTAITDGTTTIDVTAQDTSIIINKDVAKASIDLSTDINQIAKQNINPSIDTVQFNPSLTPPSHSEALLYYDSVNKAMAFFNDEVDVIQQIGQEIWIRVYNDTGGLIENGKACYLSGVFSGFPTVAKAQSNDATKCLATIGVATHSIEDGTFGYITRIGTVRSLNTSLCTAGDIIYLSESSAGDWTITQPATPNYVITLGNCGVSDASNGTVEVNISIGNNYNDIVNFYNGSTMESSSVNITSDGATVTLSVEGVGSTDLIIFFNGIPELFDTTPAQTIALTAGTDILPTRNYVYIPESTKLLTKNTSGFPTTEQYIPITDSLIPSESRVQNFGVYKDHNWTDHLENSIGNGHLSHLNKWVRKQPATYDSGILPTFTGSGTATVEMSSTSGIVLQLHEHDFPLFSSPAPLYVYNDFTTPYNRVTNIASIVDDSTGTSLLGGTYALIIWGVVSEQESDCKFYVNVPSGKYGASKPDDARIDADAYTDYSIPPEYKGTGFLLHRLIISANVGGTAFTIYTDSSDDLRGFLPNTSAGSTTGGGAGTGDMQTSIYDPAGIGEQLAGLTASQTLTNKELTSPAINTSISGTAVLDDDSFATATNTTIATSESIKAYADTKATGAASSTDNAIVRFDLATGKIIQNSPVTITDAGKQTFPDIATTGIINATERSVVPSSPATGDIYLDDGTNSASGNPQWRRYTGAVWEDIGGGTSGGGDGVSDTFIDADLTAGVLTIAHAFGLWYPSAISIYDNNNKLISPPADDITISNNSIAVDLSSFGTLTGTWLYNFGNATTSGTVNNYGNYYSASSLPLDYDETFWGVSTRPVIDYGITGAPLMRFDYASAEYVGVFVLDEIPTGSINLAVRVKVRPFSTGATDTNMGWTIKYITIRDNIATTSIATQILGSTSFETSGSGDTTDTYEIALSTLSVQVGDTIVCILYPDITVATPKQTDWMLLSVNMGVS